MNKLLMLDNVQLGLVYETIVYDHLTRENFVDLNSPIKYLKDKKGKEEVDIVMDYNALKIPVEVKKTDYPEEKKLKGIRKHTKDKIGFVICGKKLDSDRNIVFIPCWLFLLLW